MYNNIQNILYRITLIMYTIIDIYSYKANKTQYKGEILLEHKEILEYLEYLMNRFYPIGEDQKGGVTRLGYTKEEDQMHMEFKAIAEEEGYIYEIDEVGNSFAFYKSFPEYYLVGSHLDSVVNGGRYDGVLGVCVGLLLLKMIKEEEMEIPLKVGAFRCEESSNFMKDTIGSGLITGIFNPQDFNRLISREGKSLSQVFDERGYSKTPKLIQNIKEFIELHIEQGRVLESEGLNVGIVTAIAGNQRMKCKVVGMAEHSGATPMDIRLDALCGVAEIILEVEKIGKKYACQNGVATVGWVSNHPNVMNVIPGEVEFSVDLRCTHPQIIKAMHMETERAIEEICKRRGLKYSLELLTPTEPTPLDEDMVDKLSKIAESLGIKYKRLPSGAGHDAMAFAKRVKAGMVFIPCKNGISHNPKEYAKLEDAVLGAKIIYEYLKGEMIC